MKTRGQKLVDHTHNDVHLIVKRVKLLKHGYIVKCF